MSETKATADGRPARAFAQASTQSMDDAGPALGFQPGDTVGRYQVRGLLGAGGMGLVLTALDPELGRTVALKIIRPDGRAPSARARSRLLREAQALARLQHPNVVTIYDVGTAGDQVFIAMELVSGQTLSDWLAAEPRPWRAIRDVFVAAGRGLAAAHAVGIVHRDFKPSNVIVGAHRVVVIDFGLARGGADESSADDSEAGAGSSPTVLDVDLTLTGERVGTPRYMAPEQHAGGPVTALADQFAFATSLWTALFGVAPFAGTTHAELVRAMGGRPAPPPPEPKVPERVRAALVRALAARPEDRWPALGDLLAELAHDPLGRSRRAAAIAAAVCGALGVGAAAFSLGRTASVPTPCTGSEALVATVWDDAAQAQTRDAFRRTGNPYADATFARVDAALRQRLDAWTRAHRDACEATEVRHEQSPALLDARMACLGRARMEIAALVALLRGADAQALDRAAMAADRAGDISACVDPAALASAVPPPRDPNEARDAQDLREQIAHLAALRMLGKLDEGLAVGRRLVQRARILGYAPVLAAALHGASWFESTADQSDEAIELGYEAARVGAAIRDDGLVADALRAVAFALGYDKQRFEAAEVAYRSALAAAARAGNPGPLLERLYGDHVTVLNTKGDRLAAASLGVVVLALSVRLHGIDSHQSAHALMDIADAVGALGHCAEAARLLGRALAIAEAALGPEHPLVLAIVNNAGSNLLEAHDFDAAAPLCERALRSNERVHGADDPTIAAAAHNLGIARRGQRRLPEARALLERAVRIRTDKLGPDHPLLAGSYEELAEVARLQGRPDEALADIERAIAIERRAHPEQRHLLAERYRVLAEILIGRRRLGEARAALEQADAIDRTLGIDARQRGDGLRVDGDLALATRRPRAALALYQQALALLELKYGASGAGLIEVLLGLGAAELETGDAAGADAAAARAAAIADRTTGVDLQCEAQLLLARARWAEGHHDDARAVAREARARLAALPYPTETRARIDRWLAKEASRDQR